VTIVRRSAAVLHSERRVFVCECDWEGVGVRRTQQLDEPPAGADGWAETGGGERKNEGIASGAAAAAHPLAPERGARRGAARSSGGHSSGQTGRCVVVAHTCTSQTLFFRDEDDDERSGRLVMYGVPEASSPESS